MVKDLHLTLEQQQERFEAVLHSSGHKRKTLSWAMKTSSSKPQFLCSGQPPYVIEHVNALWCNLTGFTPHIIKGSHGLSLLKGPLTDESVVESVWGSQETTISVIHYTGGGTMVRHTVEINPLLAETDDTITHYLGTSSFEKYVGKGNLFHRAKAVLNTQMFASTRKISADTSDNTDAMKNPEERVKNIHQLKKENALKNLAEYADTLSESVQSKVDLTILKERPKEIDLSRKIALGKNVADTADRINSWKNRFQTAKKQAKREKNKGGSGDAGSEATGTSRPTTQPCSEVNASSLDTVVTFGTEYRQECSEEADGTVVPFPQTGIAATRTTVGDD